MTPEQMDMVAPPLLGLSLVLGYLWMGDIGANAAALASLIFFCALLIASSFTFYIFGV